MSDSIFLDTNILIYAIESEGPDVTKSEISQNLVRRSRIIISTQVLGEFYRAVTSPNRLSPLSHSEAVAWIQLWKSYDLFGIDTVDVDLALEITKRYEIGYHDALILAVARHRGCSTVYSEDLFHQCDYGGVTVINPFKVA
ncbi:MAG: PIN domain-containing protein [Verrucomicrobiota bacterium]